MLKQNEFLTTNRKDKYLFLDAKHYAQTYKDQSSILDYHVMPGAFYLELIQRSIQCNHSFDCYTIAVISFGASYLFEANSAANIVRSLQIISLSVDDSITVAFDFKMNDDTTVPNRSFSCLTKQINTQQIHAINFDKNDVTYSLNLNDIYQDLVNYGVTLKNGFMCLDKIQFSSTMAYASIKPPYFDTDKDGYISGYLLHSLFQILTFYLASKTRITGSSQPMLFIPDSLGQIEINILGFHSKIQYVYLQELAGNYIDIFLVSEEKQILAKINSGSYKQLSVDQLVNDLESKTNCQEMSQEQLEVWRLLQDQLFKFSKEFGNSHNGLVISSAIIFTLASKILTSPIPVLS